MKTPQMNARFSYRPSRVLSAFAAIVACGMLAFGIHLYLSEGRRPFTLAWIFVVFGIAVFHLVNVLSKKGVGVGVIERMAPDGLEPNRSPELRMTELEAMRDKGLVSEMEYTNKRREILADL